MALAETSNAPGRRAPKRILFWLAVAALLLAVYAGAGFALLPWLIKNRLPEFSERQIQYRATVGEVKFNPFKLVLEVADFSLTEPGGARMIGVGALTVDFEWASLAQRTWRFALVRVVAPRLNLAISRDRRFNLAELLAAINRVLPQVEEGLPRLLIERFELSRGRIDFDDRASGYTNSLVPIALTLDNFSTLPDGTGPYTLSADTARGGSIRWKGNASLNPIGGRGQLDLEAISLPDLAPYAKAFANMAVESGKLHAVLPYRFAYANGALDLDLESAAIRVVEFNARVGGAAGPGLTLPLLQVDNARASLARGEAGAAALKMTGLGVRLGDGAPPALVLPSISIEGIGAKLAGNEIAIDTIKVAGGRLDARRDARGQIDWLALKLASGSTPVQGAAAAAPSSRGESAKQLAPNLAGGPWKLSVRQFGLDDLALGYTDLTAPKPLTASIAKVGLKFAFAAARSAAGLGLSASDAELSVRDIVLGGKADAPVKVSQFGASGAKFDSVAATLALDRVFVKGAQLNLRLDQAGRLNLLDLLPGAGAGSATAAPNNFKAVIKTLDLSGISAALEDRGTGIKLHAQDAGLRLTGLSSDLAVAVGFEAGLRLREGGDLRARGRVVPGTASLDAAVKVERLALAPLQPLLSRYVKLKLAGGSVSAEGKLGSGGRGARLRYAGAFALNDLLLNEEGDKQFAALKGASADSVNLQIEPAGLEVQELRLEGPQVQVLIEADGSLNARRLLVRPPAEPGAARATAAQAAAPPLASAGASGAATPAAAEAMVVPFPVAVRRLRINNGVLDFEDLSLLPQFGARIHELGGVVTGLSTSSSTRSGLELDGRVDQFGLARIRGELNPFFPRSNTDVSMVFRNVDMTIATPYAMKFAGYKIASGRISLDLAYKVQGGQLKGDNQVVIDQLTLGERVDSPDALKLPLQLAIAILKDSDGRIDLALPVSGSLDDPQFSYGAVIWKAVVNVITRIVTAPFRALGALFGGDGARLEAIDFDPGSALVAPPEREKLRQVVQVLQKRAQLKLAVPGRYNEALDAPVLRETAMRSEILRRAGLKLVQGEAPGPLAFTDQAQRVALRDTFTARHGAAALEELRQAADRGTLASQAGAAAKPQPAPVWRRALNLAQGEPNVADPGAFYNAVAARLAASQPLAPDALVKLAGERSNAVASALRDAGIEAGRIEQPPVESGDAAGKLVPLKLALAAR